MTVSDEAKRNAFDHVIGSINGAASFPEQVFRGSWDLFLFFEADRLFAPEFATIAVGLLNAEQGDVCCLLNLSETDDQFVYESAALFIDAKTEPSVYDAMLRRGGPANGWLFRMDRYGCASNKGGWGIYCEKGNDIAVIGLRQYNDNQKYSNSLRELHAEPIKTLLENSKAAPMPFSQLVKPWRYGLVQHYD